MNVPRFGLVAGLLVMSTQAVSGQTANEMALWAAMGMDQLRGGGR